MKSVTRGRDIISFSYSINFYFYLFSTISGRFFVCWEASYCLATILFTFFYIWIDVFIIL